MPLLSVPFPPPPPPRSPHPNTHPRPRSYVGEWFEVKGESPGHPPPPLHEQRATAVHSLWVAVGMYALLGVISGVAVCSHKVRGAL